MKDKNVTEQLKGKYVTKIIDADFERSREEIRVTIKDNSNRVLFEDMLDDLIVQKDESIDFERKNRIKYEISTGKAADISELDTLYLPAETVEFRKFERLSIPAIIGAIVFGWLFYALIGSFFKSEYHAALIGMPIGAGFFVWLFSKAIRHPRMAKVIKWAALLSFVGITVGAVFSNIRGSLFGKARINFFQWLWAGIVTLLIFWMLHIFKPITVKNSVEMKKAVEIQVSQFVSCKYDLFNELLEEIFSEEPVQNLINKDVSEKLLKSNEKIPVSLVSSKHVIPSIQQMYMANKINNAEDALTSVKSFLNALESQGIRPLERAAVFTFNEEEKKYFDTFGIIRDGDDVEQIYHAWVDNSGETIIRGQVRKVRR